MRSCLLVITIITFLFSTIVNSAEISIRPGLWEITTTSDLLNFASQIPPNEMKNLNELAKEYGVDMPEIHNGAAKTTSCITQEMAKQNILPSSFQNQAGCTVKKVAQNGNYYRVEFVCVNSQLNGNGVAEGSFINAESFSGLTNFSGSVQNNPVNEQAKVNGRWINISCENVKPLQQ
ncbi:MAG: DUF3617 domain-containing protein [Pseudomonadota bacterium]